MADIKSIISAITTPVGTGLVPNPLNKYASYSYAWSLWWLDINDYNTLMEKQDVSDALAWNPGPDSYVVAEDSGLYPNRRIPGVLPVNYNIQDVRFTTVIAPNQKVRSSNMIEGALTIMEPYGVTFLDTLAVAALYLSKNGGNSYTTLPYMLQLDFFGYDDNGNPIPTDNTTLRKRFPINILTVGIEVSGRGAEYKIEFTPAGYLGHSPEKATVPPDSTIVAKTVGEFFKELETKINEYYIIDAFIKGNAKFADSITFDIDPAIAGSSIVYGSGIPLASSNPNSKDIDTSKANFNIKAGTTILSVIDKAMALSQYLIDQLKDAGTGDPKIQNNVFNAYKTVVSTRYEGVDQSGVANAGVFDSKRNTLPVKVTYKIRQHPSWKNESPHGPTLTDSSSYVCKEYNYLYTGKNIDVIDFKLSFDMTYYNAVLGYTSEVSSTQSSTSTTLNSLLNSVQNFALNPAALINNVPNISPLRYRYILGDQNLTTGGGLINNPSAQKAADTIKSIYSSSSGDMVAIDLKIIGDPTLIKQDDWLYVPSPTTATNYNSWNSQGQDRFAGDNGHIRMDAGEVIVKVTVNSPIDIDTELTNEGLVYPQMGVNNQYQSLFSGRYMVNTIENHFSGGAFTQTLQLVRQVNQDVQNEYKQQTTSQRTDTPPAISQQNQTDTGVPTYQSNSTGTGSNYDSYRDGGY